MSHLVPGFIGLASCEVQAHHRAQAYGLRPRPFLAVEHQPLATTGKTMVAKSNHSCKNQKRPEFKVLALAGVDVIGAFVMRQ